MGQPLLHLDARSGRATGLDAMNMHSEAHGVPRGTTSRSSRSWILVVALTPVLGALGYIFGDSILVRPLLRGSTTVNAARGKGSSVPIAPHFHSRILDAASYVQDPLYNTRRIALSDAQFAALEVLVARLKNEVHAATRETHRHAEEWAAIKIALGDFERDSNKLAPSGSDGATVIVSDAEGTKGVVILPGEYAPYEVSMSDLDLVLESGNWTLVEFFVSL